MWGGSIQVTSALEEAGGGAQGDVMAGGHQGGVMVGEPKRRELALHCTLPISKGG